MPQAEHVNAIARHQAGGAAGIIEGLEQFRHGGARRRLGGTVWWSIMAASIALSIEGSVSAPAADRHSLSQRFLGGRLDLIGPGLRSMP
jgi:hypothetical protein